ncbi:DUF1016 N-terminal domain-containing protein [Chitinophaga sp. CC14]
MQKARLKAVLTANVQLLATYWEIGNVISQQEKDQGWGSKVAEQLARDLSIAFTDFRGLSPRNLRYMRNFAIAWPGLSVLSNHDTARNMNSILQQAAAKLPWFHICTLLDKVKNQPERALEKAFKPERKLFEYLHVIKSIDGENYESILFSESLKLHTKEIGLHIKMVLPK